MRHLLMSAVAAAALATPALAADPAPLTGAQLDGITAGFVQIDANASVQGLLSRVLTISDARSYQDAQTGAQVDAAFGLAGAVGLQNPTASVIANTNSVPGPGVLVVNVPPVNVGPTTGPIKGAFSFGGVVVVKLPANPLALP